MLNRRLLLLTVALGAVGWRLGIGGTAAKAATSFAVTHSDAEWHKMLTSDQYAVLREEGTELPYTSELLNEHRKGNFACLGCEQDAFSSNTKFESGTGWPSFWAPIDGALESSRDTSFGMVRTEVHCSRCGSHLGHVFDDGPKPTGLRYCMNGVAMKFHPASA
ncbi:MULTISPECIES: peptide-methionine (R)-S-oxide reductase MsrB [unclassified Rhizobium]|uniref:peptide-methionine (R)-S-oxide reductase MsrB n=1 Tax=unclassified Rhizobium TaxID=2613769 RepID=UPI0008287DE1|nr:MULTISPECIES: peptide-methionine (R)-S-oxide reductase MsrB [unclassified Rhizobium]OCJ07386.1 peptide-methionine (R)-S-oxide reductase [Rhizobium sp. AC27/96]TIX88044.1 peptide-methionine (R)-S-oxide reductase MsrB [Rhizobium sp. P44RR-XXIV]